LYRLWTPRSTANFAAEANELAELRERVGMVEAEHAADHQRTRPDLIRRKSSRRRRKPRWKTGRFTSLARPAVCNRRSSRRFLMKIVALVVTLLLALFTSSTAHAQDWDSTGWVKLGERLVAGRYDHDTIPVGAYKGRFEKLTMVVTDSDLELIDLEIRFTSGRSYHPTTRHFFKEASRSRVFDLPGGERVIKAIELRYKNLPGGGRAKVQLWAR
jgi:hypothetical protein